MAILLPLVAAAIVLSLLFARWFPPPPEIEVPNARWTEITAETGLRYRHFQGGPDAPTTLGGAVVVIDFDRDGHPDLFFPNGSYWPWQDEWESEAAPAPTSALWRNDGTGRFSDVSRRAGLDLKLQAISAAVGDFDGDGWDDLFITAVGGDRLLRNRGDGSFTDVTEHAGVGGDTHTWSSGATWLDFDHDGRLDLAVCHYVRWPREIELELAFKIAGVGRSYGAPAGFVGVAPSLYRNVGDERFENVAEQANLRPLDPQTGLPRPLPLAVSAVDMNHDGWLDLLFTFQSSEEVLFLNQSDGTFREWSAGYERQEGSTAGLSATGAFPLAPSVVAPDRASLLRSLLSGQYENAPESGILLGQKLGLAVLDYDLSGAPAVIWNTSRMEPEINRFDYGRGFAAPLRQLVQVNGRWREAPVEGDGAWTTPLVARGVAVADFDGDGDTDAVVVEHQGNARLFRNDQRSDAPWLRLKLVATTSAPGAGGARVEVHTPRRIHVRSAAPATGLLAQSEAVLTFGLAEDTRVRRVVIVWPSGRRQEIGSPDLRQTLTVHEPTD